MSEVEGSASLKPSGFAWQGLSLAVVAVGGLGVNILIAAIAGPGALGLFAQGMALLLIVGQLAGLGVQWSVLYRAAKPGEDDSLRRAHFAAALLVALGGGSIIAALVYLAAPVVGALFGSNQLAIGVQVMAPAIVLLSLNKVFFNALNGRDRQGAFAFVRGLRLVVLFAAVALLLGSGQSGPGLLMALVWAEALVAAAGLWFNRSDLMGFAHVGSIVIHDTLRFGVKSLPGGLAQDINTRVDIIMLGLFLDDEAVGVYSLAAMVLEGANQTQNILRFLITPKLGLLEGQANRQARQTFLKTWAWRSAFFGLIVALAGIGGYLLVLNLAVADPSFQAGLWPLAILLSGFMLAAGARPLDLYFNQVGQPARQSMLRLIPFGANVGLNLTLIPLLGILGAALSTAISMAISAICFFYWVFGERRAECSTKVG